MRTVIICSDQSSIDDITNYLRKYDAEILGTFSSSIEGYEFVISKKPDVIFLSIEPFEMNSIDLGIKIRACLPKASIFYITPQSRHELKKSEYPINYVLMPTQENIFINTIEFIRRDIKTEQQMTSAVPCIQCFGQFKLFIDNKEIKFATQKVKELLAFLLCHYNRPIYRNDMIQSLFCSGDEKKDSNNLRVTLHRLRNAFKEAGIKKEFLLINEDCSIKVASGVCDFVDLLEFNQRNKVINDSNIIEAQKIFHTINGELFNDMDTLWITDMREFVMVQIEKLMINSAQYFIYSGNKLDIAELILITLLEMNDLSENGYTMLLDLYIQTDNKVKYIYLYRRYAKIMKIELNSVPERKYTRYYTKFNK